MLKMETAILNGIFRWSLQIICASLQTDTSIQGNITSLNHQSKIVYYFNSKPIDICLIFSTIIILGLNHDKKRTEETLEQYSLLFKKKVLISLILIFRINE